VHHHGMASLPAFDGWADQYFCYDETKDYVLPNNRHATQYYHDHAVGITSENAYNGEP
jgi:spore coat protein A, manganese oxidase